MFEEFSNTTVQTFIDLWETLVSFLPQLFGAVIILIVGLVVASVFRKVCRKNYLLFKNRRDFAPVWPRAAF